MDRQPPDTEDVRWLGWQLGRIEEIVREGRQETREAIARLDNRQADHERRITILEANGADAPAVTRMEKIALAALGLVGTALAAIATLGGHP